MGKVKYSDVIRSTSFSQKEILHNIMLLHNNGEGFDCDITYSSGKFYSDTKEAITIPQPKIKMDVFPMFDDVIKIEPLKPLPLEDNSIGSIVIDLPFVIAKRNLVSKEGSNVMINRFSSFYPTDELFENYYHWIKEAYRVLKPDGILVFKCQATITSARQLMTPEYSWMMATACGFYTLDQFFLLAKNRLHSGKIKKQQHARKFTSTLYVFKKTDKKKIKYLNFMNEETEGNFVNNLIHNMTNSKN